MKRGNLKKVFISSVFILLGFIFGLGVSVFAWVNPSQSPPLGGGVLQTDTSGLKIVTTTQITTGNFTVNNGNFGIGTTAPANKLHVVGGNGLTVSGGQPLELISGGILPVIKWYGSANLTFGNDPNTANIGNGTAGNQLVVITPSGNVGIGTTAPSQRLTVVGNIGIQAGSNAFIGTLDNYALSLRTNNTDRIFITNAGNVGIGTTAPVGPLHIRTVVDAGPNSPTDGSSLVIGNYSTYHLELDDNEIHAMNSTGASILYLNNDGGDVILIGSGAGNVGIGTTTPSQRLTVVGNIGIQAGSNAFIGTLDNYALSLRTNNTDRIFITNAGNVGIGTTTPTGKLHVRGGNVYVDNINFGGTPTIALAVGDTDTGLHSTADGALDIYSNNVNTMSIRSGNVGIGTTAPDYKLRVEGTVAAYSWVTLSDISLKKDIQPLNYGILDKVLKLNPVSFYWKDENMDKEKHFGFVAQEVEEVLPELVRQDSQGKKTLNYNELIPYLVRAIQEQQKEIEELKAILNSKH
jgi:F0F1-type ATP synthase epsilon subunit